MQHHDQGIFPLARLQSTWLVSGSQHRQFLHQVGLLRGGMVGVACGLLVALVALLSIVLGMWPLQLQLAPTTIVLSVLLSGLVFGMAYACIGGSVAKRATSERIQIVEALNWPASTARVTLTVAVIVGSVSAVLASWVAGPRTGVAYGVASGLTLGLLLLVRNTTGQEIEARMTPNQGIRRSALNALLVGASVGLASATFVELLVHLLNGTAFQLVFGPLFGLAIGTFMVLFFGGGACLKHYLMRLYLYRSGVMPWRYVRFLNFAAERFLLRRVGGGYMFLHPLFRTHFADQYTHGLERGVMKTHAESS